jgi:O-antigen/teichoic acid export membrane protein
MTSAAQRISGTFLATVVVYGIAALTGPLAARLLGPEGRGILAAIQLWPGALATVAMVGLPEALVYFGAREPGRAGEWLFTAELIAMGAACAAACIGYPIITAALRNYEPSVVSTAHLYLLVIPLTVLVGLPGQLIRALGRFGFWNILRILPGLVWLVILALSLYSRSTSPERLAVVFLGCLGVEAIVVTLLCVRVFSTTLWFDRPAARKLLQYGIPSALGGVPQFLNLRLDQLLIAWFISPRELGLYVVAVSWSGMSGITLSAIGPVLFQRIAAEHNVTQARSVFGQATRAAVIISGATAIVFASVTPLSMTFFYGASFRQGVPAALILVGASAIATMNGVLEDGIRGLGDPRAILRAELLGLLATAASLALLLGPLRIVGAAIASVVGYAAVMGGLAVSLRRHEVTFLEAFRPGAADIVNIFRMASKSRLIYRRRDAVAAIQPVATTTRAAL